MNRGLAWLLGIAAIGSAWWLAGHPGWQTREQKAQLEQTGVQTTAPKLYRWRDEHGVTQITQKPPKGRKYTLVNIRDDQNVFETTEPVADPPK